MTRAYVHVDIYKRAMCGYTLLRAERRAGVVEIARITRDKADAEKVGGHLIAVRNAALLVENARVIKNKGDSTSARAHVDSSSNTHLRHRGRQYG